MFNSGINKDIHYRVILYDDHGEVIEDTTIIGQDNAYNYGEKSSVAKVDMMYIKDDFMYYEDKNVQIIDKYI